MRKPIRYLAGLLVLSQLCSASVLVAHANKTAMQTPNYSISIPEAVPFGALHSDKNSTTDYTLSVSYHGTEHPAITVTAPERGTLHQGSDTLTFDNNMPTATLTAGASTATGTLSIGSEQVAQATEGNYTGTLSFTFTSSTASLEGSTVVDGDKASAQLSGTGILTGAHDKITVSDKHIAFDAISGDDKVAAAELKIDQETLHTIAGSGKELTIHTDLGSVAFDGKALAQISTQMNDSDAPLQLNISESDPHYEQADNERSGGETMSVYELTLTLGVEKISFHNGSISISIPCGDDVKYAYYIVDGELKEQIPVTVENGIGTFAVTHFSLWGLSSVDYFEAPPLEEEYFLADGNYYVDLWLWHQYANQTSMGDMAFEDSRQALVTVTDSQVTRVEFSTNPVNISGITSAVEFLEVEGEEITTLEKALFTTSTNELTFQYIVRGEFTMPDNGQPTAEDDITYLAVRLAVPDTPMDATSDADGCMTARFKFDWVTAEATKDSSLNPEAEEEVEVEADISATVTLTPSVDKNGHATLTIDEDTLKDSLKLIKETMEKEEDDEATSLLTIKVEPKGDINSLTITMKQDAFQSVMEGVDYLKFTTSLSNVLLDGDALNSIWAQGENNITFAFQQQDVEDLTLADEGKRALIGDRPVLGFSITNGKTMLTQLDGTMTTYIPYTLGQDEDTIKLTVYSITAEGDAAEIVGTYYTGRYMVFTTSELYSSYAVAFDENRQLYIDVPPTAWFYDAVTFVTAQDLFTGTGFQVFSPQDFMTRAMMVTVLHRMAGEPTVSGYSYYDDVAVNQWYSQGVLWSSQNRIVEGYGDGLFGTIDNVTREQVAVILYRYAGKFGYPTASNLALLEGYSDSEAISSYARYAMAWAVEQGLMTGVTETTLDPQGTATRAQVATIFMRFAQ